MVRNTHDPGPYVTRNVDNDQTKTRRVLNGQDNPIGPRDNHVLVKEQGDLPSPSGGVIELDGSTVYEPNGFVFIDTPLDWDSGDAPVFNSRHGSKDGFVYTGEGAMLRGNGSFFAERMYFQHTDPTAQILDVSGDGPQDEHFVNDCTFADAAGLGVQQNIGSVGNYRVPSWVKCNFENIASGITYTGTIDKIFYLGCPFRTVTESNVVLNDVPVTTEIDWIDFSRNFVKNVQSDTVVWRVHSDNLPPQAFLSSGSLYDETVNLENVVVDENGNDLRRLAGYKFSDSFPIADSSVGGEMYVTPANGGTITGSGTGTEITMLTTNTSALERMLVPSDGVLEYNAGYNSDIKVDFDTSIQGATTTFEVSLYRNGSLVVGSTRQGETKGSGSPVNLSGSTRVQDATEGDQFTVFIENTGGAGDLTLDNMSVTV